MADAPELKTLGRYNIERVLGKGAMGVVYEGIDQKLNRRVAIKTILKSHLDPDTAKDYSMRFSREAQAVARLNHPHIVQVYDFAEEGDIAYLVMEFIRGKELKNFFDANERFDPVESKVCDPDGPRLKRAEAAPPRRERPTAGKSRRGGRGHWPVPSWRRNSLRLPLRAWR